MWQMTAMVHYAQRVRRGGRVEIHVTNHVAMFEGQHHVHTPVKFKLWAKIAGEIKWLTGSNRCCPTYPNSTCSLKPGESREGGGTHVSKIDYRAIAEAAKKRAQS